MFLVLGLDWKLLEKKKLFIKSSMFSSSRTGT